MTSSWFLISNPFCQTWRIVKKKNEHETEYLGLESVGDNEHKDHIKVCCTQHGDTRDIKRRVFELSFEKKNNLQFNLGSKRRGPHFLTWVRLAALSVCSLRLMWRVCHIGYLWLQVIDWWAGCGGCRDSSHWPHALFAPLVQINILLLFVIIYLLYIYIYVNK